MDQHPTGNALEPRSTREDAVEVVRRLRGAGHVAYFAGGCVRDVLLGRPPKDYDVATDAPPPQVRQLFPNTQAVGAAFGVILVRTRRSMIEVATFRADGEYKDGRHPDGVRFTTAEEDAKRRDFTINGLFLDPLDGDRVLDFVGGRADLSSRLIRAIGEPERRFEEDHLRLLRAVRFAARFDFEIELATGDAIRAHAPQLKRISPERIAEELRAMLTPPTRGSAWSLLDRHRLTHEIFRLLPDPQLPENALHFLRRRGLTPSMSRPQAGQPLPAPAFYDEEQNTYLGRIERARPISFGLALATVLLTLGMDWYSRLDPYAEPSGLRGAVRALRQSLKISNEEAAELSDSLEGFWMVCRDSVQTVAQKKRFLARPFARNSRALLDACLWLGDDRERIRLLEVDFRQLELTEFAPPPLLTGDDLTAAGQTPGPVFKRVLDAVYDAQLEGGVSTKEDALAMGLSIMRGGA